VKARAFTDARGSLRGSVGVNSHVAEIMPEMRFKELTSGNIRGPTRTDILEQAARN